MQENFLIKVNQYLELYKQGWIHGEFLCDFIRNSLKENYNCLSKETVNQIEDFLAKNELYESDYRIRKAEPYLTDDVKLLETSLKLQKSILGHNTESKFSPISIAEEDGMMEVFLRYIKLYKLNKISEHDLLDCMWVYFFNRMGLTFFSNHFNWGKFRKIRKIKKLREKKALNQLDPHERKMIIDILVNLIE